MEENSQSSLAAVPTNQLILNLLQELASRVETLEGKSVAKTIPEPSAWTDDANALRCESDSTVKRDDEQLSTHSKDPSSDGVSEHGSLSENRLANSISYGLLLDDEDEAPLANRLDRVTARNADIAALYRQLGGIICVPADFRFGLTNFWSMDGTLDISLQRSFLVEAINFLETLRQNGGSYTVTDHAPSSEVVTYSYGIEPKQKLDVSVTTLSDGARVEKVASWRRILHIQGASELSAYMRSTVLIDNGDLTMNCRNPFFSTVSPNDAINMHLGKSFGQATHLGGGYRFHISWCRTRRLSSSQVKSRKGVGELKIGRLYGSEDQFLCQEAYTIHGISGSGYHHSLVDELKESGPAEFQRYWTIILLTPLQLYRPSLLKVPRLVTDMGASPLQINIVVLIEDALRTAQRSWRGLHQYVEELLGSGAEIFDPELHDSLLSDDELFSGSRKYFWLINSLQTFDNIIRQNIEAWTSYRDRFLLPLSSALEDEPRVNWKKELDVSIVICEKLSEDLERVQRLFKDQRERTLALREGLFSASAVIESRASTRLGENVKLLTYVSIFYLPLSFCTSLWSTTDTFNFATLSYVSTLVALSTYTLVFNLNGLVHGVQSRYQRFKAAIVDDMMAEQRNSAWVEMGNRYNHYRPRGMRRKRECVKEGRPSDWWIWVYWVRSWADWVRGLERKGVRQAREERERG